MNLPKRKPNRLKNYDYSQNGGYFITFCTKDRAPILSSIVVGKAALRLPRVELTEYGRITETYIQNIPMVYPHILVENYVIIPTMCICCFWWVTVGRGLPALRSVGLFGL